MSFSSSPMDVLIVESESEILTIFLLYVFPNTKPGAFYLHCIVSASTMLRGFFSLAIM